MKKIPWKKSAVRKGNRRLPQAVLVLFVGLCLGLYLWEQAGSGLDGGIGGEMPAADISAAFAQVQAADGPAAEENQSPAAGTEQAPANEETDPEREGDASLFAAYRLQREQTKAGELAELTRIAADEQAGAEAKAAAEQSKVALIETYGQEIKAETLMKAKNFGENVVIIGEKQATVIVGGEIDASEAMQIAEIVDSVCDIGYENVIIVNR
ncbi:MAG: SpoIIIAH-like family protein [Firmicutes bacterium]|nr:SpoIIIAH-like family protein [Bacillota bacterium]